MREGTLYTCPRCASAGLGGGTCPSCEVEMLDERGQIALMPSIRRVYEWPWRRIGLLLFLLLLTRPGGDRLTRLRWEMLFVFGCLGVVLLVRLVQVARGRARLPAWIRRLRTRRLRASVPRTSIADARDGLVRIRGRVHVHRGVIAEPGRPPVAAFTRRTVIGRAEFGVWLLDRMYWPNRFFRRDEHRNVGGRYAVHDGTGLALVDDDAFELLDAAGGFPEMVLAEGDEVEIVGPASWGDAPDVGALDGYRVSRKALIFDGRSDLRLEIRRLSTAGEVPAKVPLVSTGRSPS